MSFEQLLDGKVPIIQAPMAGGISTSELVVAVANAGGIGSFGFGYSTPAKIEQDLRAAQEHTEGLINTNFFIFNELDAPSEQAFEEAVRALKALPWGDRAGFGEVLPPYFPSLDEQLEPVWEHKPQILTFHFGVPSEEVFAKAKSLGIVIGITATSLSEAQQIQASGADFVVAQGIEAGGHRGTFHPEAVGDERLSTADLTKLLCDRITLPIVSAGGIMTATDAASMLSLGAAAVQLGTAFLCCDEAGTGDSYRRYLLERSGRKTAFTKGFSGRSALGIETEFTSLMEGKPTLPFPIQNTLTGPLRNEAAAADNGEYQSLWAGTGFARVRALP
ncbi:MAG: nitronate monooxygenase, partial [Pseudomonadota bacterium]